MLRIRTVSRKIEYNKVSNDSQTGDRRRLRPVYVQTNYSTEYGRENFGKIINQKYYAPPVKDRITKGSQYEQGIPWQIAETHLEMGWLL